MPRQTGQLVRSNTIISVHIIMSNFHIFAFFIFRLLCIIAGGYLLLLSWRKVEKWLTKRRVIDIVYLMASIVLIILPIISLTKDHPHFSFSGKTVSQKSPEQHVLPYPGGDVCATSKATGSTAKKVFPIKHLVGDGKTNSYQAIQTAINEAGKAGGGIVKLPTGTFMINGHLAMQDNVTLEGSGPSTIIKAGPKFLVASPGAGYSIVSTDGASNVTIANFTADQQGNKLNGNTINRFLGYVIHIHNSKNVIVQGVYTRNPFTYAIVAEDSTKFCLKNNNTQVGTSGKYDQLDGIHVLNSSFGDVLNNYIDQGYGADGDDGLAAHTIGGTVHDITYAGNKVRGGKGGSGMQIALTDSTDTIYNIKIQNNEFWSSPRGIRTGYYGKKDGSVHDITIGGSAQTGNYIHDNTFNDTKVGDAVNIYGNGIDPTNIIVTYNKTCKAGTISVGKGKNNVVKNNSDCQ
jgi:polygalacturonase